MLGSFVNLGNPVSEHPLNRGLHFWLLGLPGYAGYQWRDATGRMAAPGVVSAGATWVGGQDGFAEVQATGGNGVTLSFPYVGGVAGSTYGDAWVLSFWFTALSFGAGTYNCVIDEQSRWLSAFYSSAGANTFAGSFGANLSLGTRYRLSVAYPSTGTTTTIPVRYYANGVLTSTFSPSSDPFVFSGSTASVSLGANPSGGGTGFMTARYGGIRYVRYASGLSTAVADDMAAADYAEAVAGSPNVLRRWSRGTALMTQVAAAAGGPFPFLCEQTLSGGLAALAW